VDCAGWQPTSKLLDGSDEEDGLFSDSSCKAILADDCQLGEIGLSGDALAGDHEPCRSGETALWLVTASLARTDGDDSGLGRQASTSFASHKSFNLPRKLDTSSSTNGGASPASADCFFIFAGWFRPLPHCCRFFSSGSPACWLRAKREVLLVSLQGTWRSCCSNFEVFNIWRQWSLPQTSTPPALGMM
jgi:hypothetical protein